MQNVKNFLLLLLLLCTGQRLAYAVDRWNTTPSHAHLTSNKCTITRLPRSELTTQLFRTHFLETAPVVVTGLGSNGKLCARANGAGTEANVMLHRLTSADSPNLRLCSDNRHIAAATTKHRLLKDYGNVTVLLSSANTFSYEKQSQLLRDYMGALTPQDPDQLGSASLLLFGPAGEISAELAPLIGSYRLPPHADGNVALSFGVGASGSGVPFHVHGHGWAECIHGAKRWLLFPPDHRPQFDPDASSSAWLRDVLPKLTAAQRHHLYDCVIRPGEALYFPSHWWHSTVNVGEAVFMSTFLDNSQGADATPSCQSESGAEL